jgi:hypothetical protein
VNAKNGENFEESDMNDSEEEIKSTLQTVEVPLKRGNPAFSINAKTVYILYPALFQDPNIFGRFIMPQNINMDSMKEKFDSNEDNQKSSFDQKKIRDPEISPTITSGRRSADPRDKFTNKPQKRNVDNSLSGSVVVLNQDVIENNKSDSY